MSLLRIGSRAVVVGLGVLASLALMAAPSWASSASPSLVWSPTTSSGTYNYGTLEAGETKSETFKLTNSGGKASGALTVTVPGSSAFSITSDTCTERSLGPGKTCSVTVQFAPKTSGESDSATLTATGVHANASIKLEGKSGGPQLAWSPTTHDYGTVPAGNILPEKFRLTNSGTGNSEPLEASVTNSSGTAFSIALDGCFEEVLEPGASCEVEVDFVPAKNGESDEGTLEAGGAKVSLSGKGGLQALTLSTTTKVGQSFTENARGANGHKNYSFGFGFNENTTTAFTIKNEGVGHSLLGNFTAMGGLNGVFTLGNDKCSGAGLASGSSCTFEITYTPRSGCELAPYNETLALDTKSTVVEYLAVSISAFCT